MEKTNYKLQKEDIENILTANAKKWDYEGAAAVIDKGEVTALKYFNTEEDTHFLIRAKSPFFVAVAMLKLAEEGKINLNDTLDKYIPEYKYASQIKLKNLIDQTSAIPCYYHNYIMIKLNESEEHKALSLEDKYKAEKLKILEEIGFDEVLRIVNDKELTRTPGEPSWHASLTDGVFAAHIIEKASGMSYDEYLKKTIFTPLGMDKTNILPLEDKPFIDFYGSTLTRIEIIPEKDKTYGGFYTTVFEDIVKFSAAVARGEIISRKSWKYALKFNKEGIGAGFNDSCGSAGAEGSILSNDFRLWFEQDKGFAFVSMSSVGIKEKLNEAQFFDTFPYETKRSLDEIITYPLNTRLVRVNSSNVWNAMDLQLLPHQHYFVDDAKASLAYGASDKNLKPYILMEGLKPIGILILLIDKKKEKYDIEIVLIDKRYQSRGFGRTMLTKAVEMLKAAGAKKLKIGVARENIPATNLYLSLGFKPEEISEEIMNLVMGLEE